MPRPEELPPARLIPRQDELALSGEALTELMTAVLAKGVAFRFKAKGFSMSPFIKDDDVITVFPLLGNKPGRGDVVAFHHPKSGRIHVHRLLKKTDDAWLIKGDNVLWPDGMIPQTNIIGIIRKLERKDKRKKLGLGPERVLIARVSGNKYLTAIFKSGKKILARIFFKRGLHG